MHERINQSILALMIQPVPINFHAYRDMPATASVLIFVSSYRGRKQRYWRRHPDPDCLMRHYPVRPIMHIAPERVHRRRTG